MWPLLFYANEGGAAVDALDVQRSTAHEFIEKTTRTIKRAKRKHITRARETGRTALRKETVEGDLSPQCQ